MEIQYGNHMKKNKEGNSMDDLEKTKIDILRDALKDASDTVRALDRKINFLVSYNAVFLGLIGTIFIKFNDIKTVIYYYEIFYLILLVLSIFWVYSFICMMINISPQSNPVEVFKSDNDQKFANNTFFIFTDGAQKALNLETLSDNYGEINSFDKVQALLYKEIGKVSYIRDLKSKSIEKSVKISQILTVVFVSFVVVYSLLSIFVFSDKVNEAKYNQTVVSTENNDSVLAGKNKGNRNIHINKVIVNIKSQDINVSRKVDADSNKDVNNSMPNVQQGG